MRPTITVLADELIIKILDEAKRILYEIGVEVRGKEMPQRLLEVGIEKGKDGRFHFPPSVIDQAIADAPSSFDLYDRDGNKYTEIGGNNVHYTPGSSALKMQDHRTGQTRLATTADFVDYVRLCDGLQNIAYPSTAFSTNDDIEAQVSDIWRLYLCLTQSKKPIVSGAFTEHGVPRMANMLELFRQDRADLIARPMSIFTITATGNFRYSEDSAQNLLDCVEAGIPIEIVPVTLMGLIAPVTVVGATVFHTADVLAGITMAQLIKPGAPVLFGGAPATFHMKAATSPMAAIEAQRLNMAYVAVAKYLGLPTQAYMALSDGKFLDAQAGAETFGQALLAAQAGVNSVSGPGMLDFVMVFSLPKLVFDNEMCAQALQFVREIKPVGDLPTIEMARNLLDEQHMITDEHTLTHWENELYLPNPVVDRQNWENWEKAGEMSLVQRATAEVDRLLNEYRPIVTETAVDTAMRQIIHSGLKEQTSLPEVPAHKVRKTAVSNKRTRKHKRNR